MLLCEDILATWTRIVDMKNELYHHGILGQKWGKKNGPPYPLDADDHSASEKKAGWKKSISKDSPLFEDLDFGEQDPNDPKSNPAFDKSLKEMGYSHDGDLIQKQLVCKNPKGNDQKFDVMFEPRDLSNAEDRELCLKTLKSIENNIETVDKKARHYIVDQQLDSYGNKPWKYEEGNDAYPKESKMSLASQRDDMYKNLGTFDLGSDRPKGKRYLKRATGISMYGPNHGLFWYADGGAYYGHEITVEFYVPDGDARKMKFSNMSIEG